MCGLTAAASNESSARHDATGPYNDAPMINLRWTASEPDSSGVGRARVGVSARAAEGLYAMIDCDGPLLRPARRGVNGTVGTESCEEISLPGMCDGVRAVLSINYGMAEAAMPVSADEALAHLVP